MLLVTENIFLALVESKSWPVEHLNEIKHVVRCITAAVEYHGDQPAPFKPHVMHERPAALSNAMLGLAKQAWPFPPF